MSFKNTIEQWPRERLLERYDGVTEADVQRALQAEERSLQDLAALLSPVAKPYLEAMA